jgi:hypothetical protein
MHFWVGVYARAMDKKGSTSDERQPQKILEAELPGHEIYARGALGVLLAGLLILVSNGFVFDRYLLYAVSGGLVVIVLHLYKPIYPFLLLPTGAWYVVLIYLVLQGFDPFF